MVLQRWLVGDVGGWLYGVCECQKYSFSSSEREYVIDQFLARIMRFHR